MSTISVIAQQPPSMPPPVSVSVTTGAYGKADGDGDHGIESVGSTGQTVNNNLSHAVHQALGQLPGHAKASTADTTAAPGQGMPPITMQGFIQALISSLHQIGGTNPAASQAAAAAGHGMQAVATASGRYAPAPTSDVQSLIRQSATVLSSDTALQQDFQNMLRAAGIDQSSTSLQHFLRSVSSQMKPSSVVDAIA